MNLSDLSILLKRKANDIRKLRLIRILMCWEGE